MNERFITMKQEIEDMRRIADSMATHNVRETAHILRLQQDLAYARIGARKSQQIQGGLMFGFWAAFITYLEFF